MTTREKNTEAAARMGRDAGTSYRDTGMPTRNPFDALPDLAAAWRAAYFEAAGPLPSGTKPITAAVVDETPDATVTTEMMEEPPVTAPAPPAPPAAVPSLPVPDVPLGTDLTPRGQTWSGPLAELDTASSDLRALASGGCTVRPLPLPLSWQQKSDDGHAGKVTVGRVLSAEVVGNQIIGSGDYLDPMTCFDVTPAMGIVDAGLGLVSVDIAVTEQQLAHADGTTIDMATWDGSGDVVEVAAAYEFGGVTIVDFPAFSTARIVNDPMGDEPDTMEAPIMPGDTIETFASASGAGAAISDDGTSVTLPDGTVVGIGDDVTVPDGSDVDTATITAINPDAGTVTVTYKPDGDNDDDDVPGAPLVKDIPVDQLLAVDSDPKAVDTTDAALLASSYTKPYTAAFFKQQKLTGPTPITIDPTTGQVFGHCAEWSSCHTGKLAETGKCVTPPRGGNNGYSYFHLTPIETDEGTITIGRLTVGTGHAAGQLGFRGALAHYDNSGAQVAVVRAYEDQFGIQVTGQLIHGVPASRVQELALSPLSGDWRVINGKYEMMAALGVNVPGFAIRPTMGMNQGKQVSLVAAGVVGREAPHRIDQVTLPSGQVIPAADFEALVAGMVSAYQRHETGHADNGELALAKVRMAMRARRARARA